MRMVAPSLVLLLVFSLAVPEVRASEAPGLAGPYFGQSPPGKDPQRFAPGFLSTPGYDITPTFSPALDEVVFGHRPTEGGSDNKLYVSRLVDGRWQEPALAPFSSGGMEYEAQFSVDGERLYFNRGRTLCCVQRAEGGWGEARALEPPVAEGMCIAAARDGSLYFTAAREGAYGIHRSQWVDGGYRDPEIVIPHAAHPWVAPDESYLLFDKYALAEGGQTSQLYVSFRESDGGWTKPIALGPKVNATGTELIPKVSPDGRFLFFQRKVDGNTDIFWVDATVIDEARSQDDRD